MVIWPFIYIRRLLFFICLFPSTFLSLFLSRFRPFFLLTESLLFSRSVANAYSHSRSPYFALILLTRANSASVWPIFRLSRSCTPMRSILASIFFLAGNTRTIKGTARQKYCPLPRKRHGNFNASATLPAILRSRFSVSDVAGPGTRYSRQRSTAISRFLSNLLTYFAFAAVRSLFFHSLFSPPSSRPSSTPAVFLRLSYSLL